MSLAEERTILFLPISNLVETMGKKERLISDGLPWCNMQHCVTNLEEFFLYEKYFISA